MKTKIFQRNQKFIMQDVNKLRKNGISCKVQKTGNEVAIIVETKKIKEIFFKPREFEKCADLLLDQKKYEWHKMKKEVPEANKVVVVREPVESELVKKYKLKGDLKFDYMIGIVYEDKIKNIYEYRHGGEHGAMSEKDLTKEIWNNFEWRYLND